MHDRELQSALLEFMWALEMVLHHDWEYAQTMLMPVNEMIGEDGTFLEPCVEDEASDWTYRAMLLERYRRLKALMDERGIPPVRDAGAVEPAPARGS